MNRSELVRAVAERAGSDEAAARRHVDAVVDIVMDRVSAGERVIVTGFGTFDRVSRPARVARNPRTGFPVEVPAVQVPRFRTGQTFRNRVAGGAPAEAEEQAAAAAPDATVSVVVEPPSPKKPKNSKNAKDTQKSGGKHGKKAKKGAESRKGAESKKASKKAKASKAVASSSAKKTPGKAKARAKAGK